jgi:hypothetical protein
MLQSHSKTVNHKEKIWLFWISSATQQNKCGSIALVIRRQWRIKIHHGKHTDIIWKQELIHPQSDISLYVKESLSSISEAYLQV